MDRMFASIMSIKRRCTYVEKVVPSHTVETRHFVLYREVVPSLKVKLAVHR